MSSCPLVRRLEDVRAADGDRPAVVSERRTLSYRELLDESMCFAGLLAEQQIPQGTVIAITSPLDERLPVFFFGARAAGLVPVLLDETVVRGDRLDAVLASCRPAALISTSKPELRLLSAANVLETAGVGYLVFSSGSQGAPKAILGQTAGLLHFVDWEAGRLRLGPESRVAMLTSPSFDVIYRDMLLPLMHGAQMVICPPSVRLRSRLMTAWLEDQAITVLHCVPSLSRRWAADPDASCRTLEWTLFAGEPLHASDVRRWRCVAPNSRVLNLYGPSETTLAKFFFEPPEGVRDGLQPVGKPLPGTSWTIDTSSDSRTVTITTAQGSLGYLPGTAGAHEAERLVRRNHLTVFQTQDRGIVDREGNLVITGRLDSLVKRHGRFVDLAPIHAAAVSAPGVVQCFVFQRSDGRIVSVVSGTGLTRESVRASIDAQPNTEAPDVIECLPSLPTLPSGKVDGSRLKSFLEQGLGA